MARRLPFNETTRQRASHYLPFMLSKVVYSECGVHLLLRQFTAGTDPIAYFEYIVGIQKAYPDSVRAGGWLQSIARLVVCWVAEELKTMGHGNGFDDVLVAVGEVVPHDGADGALVATTEIASNLSVCYDPAAAWPAGYADALRDYQQKHMDGWYGDALPPCQQLPTIDANDLARQLARMPHRMPSANAQSLRTLGNCEELRQYLKGRKRKHDAISCLDMSNELVHSETRRWLRETSEGRARLAGCDVDADAFDVDHVWPRALGGPDVIENYHVMPCGVNARFRDMSWNTREKSAYVGAEQIRIVRNLASAGQKLLPWHLVSRN